MAQSDRSRLNVDELLALGSRPPAPGLARPAGSDRIPYLTSDRAREAFLGFYEAKGHTVLPSFPLVPRDDPSILWVNCGMAPLKPYFQGLVRPPNVRLASSQKSIRLNDIENVGRTPRHHTFFEMLGNFSVGEYFKAETITWAWELCTRVFGLPPELLWVTVHPDDREARDLWQSEVGFPPGRIVDDESNFWDIGPGPCGPNSEIYIDRGPGFGCGGPECNPLCECGRYLEFYNLVFTQFNHNEDGSRTPLPRKNIDTGMGLERISSIVQGVASNFETDLFWPLIAGTSQLIGVPYGERQERDLAMRVIADHLRSVVFAIADGPLPSNEGRGYVIRRLIRRAARYGLTSGVGGPFLYELVPVATGLMASAYPEVAALSGYLSGVVRQEEERFGAALRDGTRIAGDLVAAAKEEGRRSLKGEDVFLLYDTFGFPFDLTEDLAREAGLDVDRPGFEAMMDAQRERARAARGAADGWESAAAVVADALRGLDASQFVGYEQLTADATVLGIVAGRERAGLAVFGDDIPGDVYVLLDRTPFYPEGGGQVADAGTIAFAGGRARVEDVQKLGDGRIVHRLSGERGILRAGDSVRAEVETERRAGVAAHHTATHLLHRSLKDVLGEPANQAGSLVAPDRLRFDFTYPEAITPAQLQEVEDLVNRAIRRNSPVTACEMALAEAKAQGAIALFGEKYQDIVRVVSAGDRSKELCGGTHVTATGEIGLFLISSEGSIGSGLRRIEAVTGRAALAEVTRMRRLLIAVSDTLRSDPAEAAARAAHLLQRIRELERDCESLRARQSQRSLEQLLSGRREVAPGVTAVSGEVEAASMDELRRSADFVRDRLGDGGVGVLAARLGDRAGFVVTVGQGLVRTGIKASEIAKRLGASVGGSGGGRADMAQAGAREPGRIGEALARLDGLIGELAREGRKD